jgi:hypothetical protein
MKSISESIDVLIEANKTSNLHSEIRKTLSFEKVLTEIKSKFTQLEGSEKQIKWAQEIRNDLADYFALFLCVQTFYSKALELGLNKNILTQEIIKQNKSDLNKKYKFIFSKKASEIINNRNI